MITRSEQEQEQKHVHGNEDENEDEGEDEDEDEEEDEEERKNPDRVCGPGCEDFYPTNAVKVDIPFPFGNGRMTVAKSSDFQLRHVMFLNDLAS